MADKKRVPLTLEEKTMIFQRKEEHPNETWEGIANLFTEKWGRKINKSMAFKCHKQIKEKNLGTESNQADLSELLLPIGKKILAEI